MMNQTASRFSFVLLLLLAMPAGYADIYMSRDAAGNLVFSDRAGNNAEKIEVKDLPTVPAFVAPAKPSPVTPISKKMLPEYQNIVIVSPQDQQTFQNGEANDLVLVVDLIPALLPDDALVLFDNGRMIRHSRNTHFSISDLDRGEHILEAGVFGADGKEKIRSPGVQIYIHRASVLKR